MEKMERYDLDWRGITWMEFLEKITKYVDKKDIECIVGDTEYINALLIPIKITAEEKYKFINDLDYHGNPMDADILYTWSDSDKIKLEDVLRYCKK